MPSLKALKQRIKAIKSNTKITSAMKMISAARFRRYQSVLQNARAHDHAVQNMMPALLQAKHEAPMLPKILQTSAATKEEGGANSLSTHPERVAVLVFTSDRGMCGNFNASLIRYANRFLVNHISKHEVHLFNYGTKGSPTFQRIYENQWQEQEIVPASLKASGKWDAVAKQIADFFISRYEAGKIDKVYLLYNHFYSALQQKPTSTLLLPLDFLDHNMESKASNTDSSRQIHSAYSASYNKINEDNLKNGFYTFDSSIVAIVRDLSYLLIFNRVYNVVIESLISEHAARMTAMDNATRNAKSLLEGLQLQYNRTRQAYITKELIEIISGAEAA